MDSPIEYTQHNIAFPTLTLPNNWEKDELMINAPAEGGGVHGEFTITFMEFNSGDTGVEVSFFGDGIDLFYNDRVQKVMAEWRKTEKPDEAKPWDFIRWFESVGAKPSEYHRNGI